MRNAAAVIYVPTGHSIERVLSRAWAYLNRRGYRLYGVARNMEHALDDLDAGEAQVVVMLDPDDEPRCDPGMTTVIDLAAKRDRMLANEPTVRLPSRAEQLIDDAQKRWGKAGNNSWPR